MCFLVLLRIFFVLSADFFLCPSTGAFKPQCLVSMFDEPYCRHRYLETRTPALLPGHARDHSREASPTVREPCPHVVVPRQDVVVLILTTIDTVWRCYCSALNASSAVLFRNRLFNEWRQLHRLSVVVVAGPSSCDLWHG